MKRFTLVAVALVALNAFFWLAGTGFALPRALINDFFGPRMIRAEVLVAAPGGTQDWRIDRGVITAVSGTSVTLLERDGTQTTIQLDPAARVQPARYGIAQLRRRFRVVVYHQANAPAELVQVEGIGP